MASVAEALPGRKPLVEDARWLEVRTKSFGAILGALRSSCRFRVIPCSAMEQFSADGSGGVRRHGSVHQPTTARPAIAVRAARPSGPGHWPSRLQPRIHGSPNTHRRPRALCRRRSSPWSQACLASRPTPRPDEGWSRCCVRFERRAVAKEHQASCTRRGATSNSPCFATRVYGRAQLPCICEGPCGPQFSAAVTLIEASATGTGLPTAMFDLVPEHLAAPSSKTRDGRGLAWRPVN